MKFRLDRLLVTKGLAHSRERAQALVLEGRVLVEGQKAEKAGAAVDEQVSIELLGGGPKFASRGGLKLEAALEAFSIDLSGRVCLDVGASTGGFTDCLLQRGARRVYAVDVGAGQMDWRLRQDPRVVLREKLNARYLALSDLGEPVDFAAVDVSFISAASILPRLPAVMKRPSAAVVLVKPQFEVGRKGIGKGGIVRNPALHAWAVEKVTAAALATGFEDPRSIPSPIEGAEGNREFLLYLALKSEMSP